MDNIPKIVHYCWFGPNKKPLLVNLCMDSWKKYLCEYSFVEWNERNFDIKAYRYVKEAYDAGMFAFVSDVVRLHALYNEGGIYLDSDTELLKPLDEFLHNDAFSGFQEAGLIPTSIIGAKRNNGFIGRLLGEYNTARFIKENGELDLTTNVERITKYAKELGIDLWSDEKQTCEGFTVYPNTFFCPTVADLTSVCYSENTCSIHHFAGSWVGKKTSIKSLINLKKKVLNTLPLRCLGLKIGIWGIGESTKSLFEDYTYLYGDILCELTFIVTNLDNSTKQYYGKKVISAGEVCAQEFDEIIISSFDYEDEIYNYITSRCTVPRKVKITRLYMDNEIETPIFNKRQLLCKIENGYKELKKWTSFPKYYELS